jgi:oxygen-dependent protoporphyrinogen oxidase
LQSFAERRFGRQAFQRLIQPLIGGIYTADPTQLSMAATMPQFLEMERQRGSLIRAMRHAAGQQQHADDRLLESGARYGLFVAPRDGMSSLVSAIVARLPAGCVQLQAPVHRLQQQPDGQWKIEFAASADCPPRDGRMFDAVVLAVPAPHAAQLIRSVSGELSSLLTKIPHASAAVVITGYRREQVQHPLDGFGFVVPAMENRRILATSFASVKYAGRAPAGQVLLRTFVGGACQPELLERDDAAIKQMVAAELSELLGVRGAPLLCEVVRWTSAMPQYHVGHLQLVEQIERCAAGIANFALAGNAFRGVGIPFCIHSGERAAERLLRGIMPTQS